MNRTGLALGLLVILLSNAWALWDVAANRAEGAVRTVELTERELPMQSRDQDDTSVRLRLAFRRTPYEYFPRPSAYEFQFDRAKLQELGFDCSAEDASAANYRLPQPRVVYVAMEYQGRAWEEWREHVARQPAGVEEARAPQPLNSLRPFEAIHGMHTEGTRLFVVDASRDFLSLHRRYPDAARFLIVRAAVTAVLQKTPGADSPANSPGKAYRWGGYVSQVIPFEVHVRAPYARDLATLEPRVGGAPRYRVRLHYGTRVEPWVDAIERIQP